MLTQDGNLLAAGKWMLNKYDDYGRPVSSGLHTGTNPDPNNASLAYSEQHTATTYGTSGVELGKVKTTQTWIPGNTSITRTFTYDAVTGRLLTDNGPNHLTNNTGSDNYTYTYDYAGNRLTETRAHKTSTASATLTLITRNTYDHAGRNTALYHKIDANAEKQLASYAYDLRDRLIDKGLGFVTSGGTNSFLQSVDYAYNEQNWLTSINGPSSFSALSQDAINLCPTNPTTPNPAEVAFSANPDGNDIFKLDLYYDSPGLTFGSPTGQRNGNISQLVWQTRGRQRQGYTLQYDYLDRLTTSYYADINSAGTATTDNKYREDITYADATGNILNIQRKGLYKDPGSATCFTNGIIDVLTYTYNYASNRIQKISDATTGSIPKAMGFNPGNASGSATYGYDANGNLTSDPYKGVSGMTLTYNHLNLPISMNFGSDGTINILYDYVGKKLRKTVTPTTSSGYTQDYVNGLEYRTNSGGGSLTLEAIYHAEGRITPLGGSNYQYEYAIKDHLGNTRLTFSDLNGNNIVDVPGDILQENHYYPFGMNMNYGWINNTGLIDNRYQYNGKEYNDDFGLNWNDYGARWYDAAVGRWWSVDPLAEKSSNLSLYNYAVNNPVIYIDPNGQDVIIVIKRGENGANGTITVTNVYNYNNNQGNSFLESAVRSFKDTWGNGEVTQSGDTYQGKAFNDIEIEGEKYNVTYQVIFNGTDNVVSATGEGENILNIIPDSKTDGSKYSEGVLNYRASQEDVGDIPANVFGHEMAHGMGIGHNDNLVDEKGNTSISAGNTHDRSVIQQDVVNSVEGAVKFSNKNSSSSRSVITLTTDRNQSGLNTVNLKQGKTTTNTGQYPVIENQTRQ